MKRLISKIIILSFISMILCIPLSSSSVKVDAASDNIVLMQAFATNETPVSADTIITSINAVSQYYWKNTSEIGKKDENGNLKSAIEVKSKFTGINENTVCTTANLLASTQKKDLCKDNSLKGTLAILTMTSNGDIRIEVQSGAELKQVQIRYIIANKAGEGQLYCNNSNDLCPRAAKTYGNNSTNWVGKDASGNFLTYNSSIGFEGPFRVSDVAGGKVLFSNYNVIEKMPANNREQAETYGAYVVISTTISYGGKDYFVNSNRIDNNGDRYDFASIGNDNNNALMQVVTCNNPYKSACADNISVVSSVAALIRSPSSDPTADENYNSFVEAFEKDYVPVIKVIVIIMFFVTGGATMINIIKASDDPEERSSQIKRFVWMFIGAAIIYLILEFYDEVIDVVAGWFN